MSAPSIDETLSRLERSRVVRQIGGVVFVLLIAVLTVLGLNFIDFEYTSLLIQLTSEEFFLADFFPINFEDFTMYSKNNEIEYLGGVTASFRNFGAPIFESLTTDRLTLVRGSLITLVIGFLGTVIGFPLALTFGVLGSERVTPFPFNFIFRGLMSAIRSIPALVWVFIYAPLVGVNVSGAVLAISTDTIGNLGRLFTDELEEIDEGPIEAIKSTGGSRSQVIGFGMLSQVFRSFIAWTLYILEINVRIAIGLGIVGAGGIGLYISNQQEFLRYEHMAAGIVMVFLIVISVELISSRLRARLRPSEHESKGFFESLRDMADMNRWFGTNVGSEKKTKDDE